MKSDRKLVYTINECSTLLGISRATAYSLAREGRLPVIRISDRRLIVPVIALDKMLAEAGIKAGCNNGEKEAI